MKIGNNGNLVLGPFDESTPCLMIVWMNCQTKLRINHLTAVKSVAILESNEDDTTASILLFEFPHLANVSTLRLDILRKPGLEPTTRRNNAHFAAMSTRIPWPMHGGKVKCRGVILVT
ncbi:alpha-2 adrenergic receptor [Trichonephila clavipes]|nr:alpha-2 adrenergic receptor [Trichonephila clavipes]